MINNDMTNRKKEEALLINQKIISIELGIGKINGISSLYDGVDDFFEIEFPNSNVKNYFSIKNNKQFRILSTKEYIQKAIDIFNSKNNEKKFLSTKDKIKSYESILKCNDICIIAEVVSSLKDLKDLHPQVKKVYDKCIKSFVLEIKHVLNIRSSDAWDLIKMKPIA